VNREPQELRAHDARLRSVRRESPRRDDGDHVGDHRRRMTVDSRPSPAAPARPNGGIRFSGRSVMVLPAPPSSAARAQTRPIRGGPRIKQPKGRSPGTTQRAQRNPVSVSETHGGGKAPTVKTPANVLSLEPPPRVNAAGIFATPSIPKQLESPPAIPVSLVQSVQSPSARRQTSSNGPSLGSGRTARRGQASRARRVAIARLDDCRGSTILSPAARPLGGCRGPSWPGVRSRGGRGAGPGGRRGRWCRGPTARTRATCG